MYAKQSLATPTEERFDVLLRKYYRSNKRRNKGGHHDMRRRGLLGQRSVLGEADDLQRAERLFLWHNDPHLEQFQFQFYR